MRSALSNKAIAYFKMGERTLGGQSWSVSLNPGRLTQRLRPNPIDGRPELSVGRMACCTPKEFRLIARGCRASRLPRVAEKSMPYPKGVPSGFVVFESQSQTNHLPSAITSRSNNLDQHGDQRLWDRSLSCCQYPYRVRSCFCLNPG